MRTIVLPLNEVLAQPDIWVDGTRLEDMDRHHRANLIPFLRGNKRRLYLWAHPDATLGDATGLAAEEWLVATPLMVRLVELEAGRSIDERRETAERNATHEQRTGYQKIRESCPECDGSGLVPLDHTSPADSDYADCWLECLRCDGSGAVL